MKNSIIFISALSLAAIMLACESIPSAYNPFASDDDTATKIEPTGPPVPGEVKEEKSHP